MNIDLYSERMYMCISRPIGIAIKAIDCRFSNCHTKFILRVFQSSGIY